MTAWSQHRPVPTRHRFSVEDYDRMAETGVLRPVRAWSSLTERSFMGYRARTVLRAADQAAPVAVPDVAVDVAERLKR